MGSTSSASTSAVALENLYPAIIQCFFIILVGYIIGRTRVISPTESKGIGLYVSYIALPALLFKSMIELNFSMVNWVFWSSILLAKTIVYILVFIFTIILDRPVQLGTAGLYSVFSTQSNDFALGYPIIKALYEETHPEYINYLYLFAPINLLILNPIAFVFLEINRSRSIEGNQEGFRKVTANVIKRILFNPILSFVFIGFIFHFIFNGKVPLILEDILQVLSDSYNATALFYLGLGLVGKIRQVASFALLVPAILIAAKSIILPLLARAIVSAMDAGGSSNATDSLSTYAFIYGTFPTAPTVYVYATLYDVSEALIATGMVVGTFLSAPLMFVSATMEALPIHDPSSYESLVAQASLYISIIGAGCCIWVLGIFIISGRCRWMPHNLTVNLVISQLCSCIGIVLYQFCNDDRPWQHYIQFIAFLVGVFGSRCWTSMISLALCILRCKSMCYVLNHKYWFYMYGWGVTVLAVGVLLAVSVTEKMLEVDPVFQYGNLQVIMSAIILTLNIVITTVSLVILQRNDRFRKNEYLRVNADDNDNDDDADNTLGIQPEENENGSDFQSREENHDTGGNSDSSDHDNNTAIQNLVVDIESIHENTCRSTSNCSELQRQRCRAMLHNYEAKVGQVNAEVDEVASAIQRHQLTRHIVLLLLLVLSMCIGLFLCLWRLFNDARSGIYVELEFLDSVFTYGQGFFVLACFGFDTQYVIMPFIKRWRKFWYGVEQVRLPKSGDLSNEIRFTCEQFTMYHKDRCRQELVQDLRYRLRVYKNVFRGNTFVDWLIEVGLAKDRSDAVEYGGRLLLGSVIQHVKKEHHFHDRPYFYQLVEDTESV
ncbi:lysosomal cholesterol signaling protein-like [Ptychodera flava]|uniref:lysosomal cholesterol signaling protein-like n=1 Tax=Ptychodera flava TaxID=63121 RepID=UPI003969FC95